MEKSGTEQHRYFYQNRTWRWRVEGVATVAVFALALLLLALVVVQASGRIGMNIITTRLPPNMLMTALIALPAALIMASGSYDLSVGGVISVTVALVALNDGQLFPAVIVAFFIALIVGVFNGALAAVTRINGVVITLITLFALRGLSRYLFRDTQVGSVDSPLLESLPHSPLLWALLIVLTIATTALVYFTPFGKRPQRGEPDEPVGKRLLFVGLPYVFSSLLAVIVALVMLGLFRIAVPEIGANVEIDVLMAVLAGGTAFNAGTAFIPATLVGAFVAAAVTTLGLALSISGGPVVDLLRGGFVLILFLWATAFHTGANGLFRRRTQKTAEGEADDSLDEDTSSEE